jgi:hypothetical protein
MYGQERLARNDFASYVVQDGSGILVRLLATDSAFLKRKGFWWNPALDYGRDRSELREDLNNAEIIQWFLLSQLTIFDRRDLWPTSEDLRRHLERFVVPAIAPARFHTDRENMCCRVPARASAPSRSRVSTQRLRPPLNPGGESFAAHIPRPMYGLPGRQAALRGRRYDGLGTAGWTGRL